MNVFSLRGVLGVSLALTLAPLPALAQSPSVQASAGLCENAITATERDGRVPLHLLGAIARVESGRPDPSMGSARPWPWSINAGGRGYMFASKAEAIAAVTTLRASGIASIDVGCMQINLMHHPTAFLTLDEAFDPVANIRYSVQFLSALHAETGAWNSAVAFYHSRTSSLALQYQRKVGLQLPGTMNPPAISREQTALADAWAATKSGGREPSRATPSTAAWVAALGGAGQQRVRHRTMIAAAQ